MANQPSITAQAGRKFVIKCAIPGVTPTVYTQPAGLRTTGIKINGGAVDITNKDSLGWRELLPDGGVRSVDMDFSGIWDSATGKVATSALGLLQGAALGSSLIEAVVISGGGDRFFGTWAVTFNRNGPHDNGETYDGTLMSSGPVVYSAT